jgi:hypothetical protein
MPITRPAAGEWQAIPRRAHGIVHTSFVEIDADDGVEAAALEHGGDILGVVLWDSADEARLVGAIGDHQRRESSS